MNLKQMTTTGPRRRLGDVLQAQMHRVFTTEADYLFEMGYMDRDERIQLSSLVGQALDVFTQGMPEALNNRYLDYPYMDAMEMSLPDEPGLLTKLYNDIRGVFQKALPKKPKVADTATTFFKDTEGQWWMVGIYSNRFEDRQGEIIPQAAHDEYAQWLKTSGFKAIATVAHAPRLPRSFWMTMWEAYHDDIPTLNKVVETVYADYALGDVVRTIPLNGFMSVVVKIYPHRQAQAEALSAMSDDLGMSHGFIAAKEDDKVIAAYRSFEFTVLPRERAANYWTQPLFSEVKDTMPISKADRDFLVQIGYPADVLDKGTEEMFEKLAPLLKFKDAAVPVETEETPPPPTPEPSYEAVRQQLLKDLNVDGLQAVLSQMSKQIADLTELTKTQAAALTKLESQTKSLAQDEDTRIANQFQAPVWGQLGFSATQESLKEKEPAPEQPTLPATRAASDNPLDQMLWGPLNGK